MTTTAPFMTVVVAVVGFTDADNRPPIGVLPFSTPVLKQRLAEAQTRLWAWEVAYESARESGVGDKPYLHRVVAAKAPDQFFHWSAHGSPWLHYRDDPYQQRLTVNTDRMFVERPLDRLCDERSLRPDDPLPGSAPHELLLIAWGWWPLHGRPSPTLVDMLPAALSAVAQSEAYQARPRLEQLGGRWCQVLECQGRDQLWLDVGRNCAVVARQIDYPEQARIHRVELSDFRELLSGVWVPFRLRNLHYKRAQDGAVGQLIVDATLTVLSVRLNEGVDDAQFRVHPLPGSAGNNRDKPFGQTVPGGENYLDEVVEWIRRYTSKAGHAEQKADWEKWEDVVLGALLGLGASNALFLILGLLQRARSPSPRKLSAPFGWLAVDRETIPDTDV